MAPPVRRAAAPAARAPAPAARRLPARPSGSSGYSGAAGLAKMQEEEARNEAAKEASSQMQGMPFRFFCPIGESREIVVVDDKPDWFRYEHNLKNPRSGKYDIFTACINEACECPVCKGTDRPSYFAMYLSIIDLTGYVNRNNEEVPWSKKLLVVKSTQQKKIMRLYERHGTLRGMILQMTRDGEKDAAIGNDIEFVEFMSEEDMATYETVYEDQNGKSHEVVGHEAFIYDDLFPMPSEEQLRAIVGGRSEPGSRDSDSRELRGGGGGRSRDGWDDRGAAPARAAVRPSRGAPAPAATRRPVRGAPLPPDDGDYPEPEGEAEAPAPRAAVRRAAPAPAPAAVRRAAPAPAARAAAPVRRAAAPAAEEAYDEPADPPQRSRAAPSRAAPAAAPAPQSAGSLADRRRALRR